MNDRSHIWTDDEGRSSHVLDAALSYGSKGFRVFPCLPLRKEPAIKAWQIHATTDPQTIRGWFTEFPDRNVAIACGPQPNGINLLVIDIDPRHGGLDAWRELIHEHGDVGLRGGPVHRTPNGGFHLFFDAPEGFRNSRNRLGPGIDTRGDGGYVLVPESTIQLDDEMLSGYVTLEPLWPV